MKQKVTLAQELRRRWPAYVAVAVIWGLVVIRVFSESHATYLPILYNKTDSLPYTFAYVRYGHHNYARGDLVVYAFDGGAQRFYPGLRNQPFFKIIRGVPGDRVTVQGREVFINGESVGVAGKYGPKRVVLDPIDAMVIPPGYFYMQGISRDSFDSRYKLSGLVRSDQVLAEVVPIF